MNALDVPRQVSFLRKSPRTLLTLERPLSSMTSLVALKRQNVFLMFRNTRIVELSSFQMTVESNYVIATLSDWLKNLVPLFNQ